MLVVLLAACNLAGVPGAAQTGSNTEPRAGPKRIVAGILGNPPTISNRINSLGAGGIVAGASEVEGLLNAGLIVSDKEQGQHPQLAEAVPSLENGLWKVLPDGRMETTWRIRDGAEWHDGTAFTVDDVRFTLRLAQDRELALFRSLNVDGVTEVDTPDARTVTFRWKEPYIFADSTFNSGIVPRHLLEPTYIESKQAITQLPYWAEEFIGTGPFRLRTWEKASHLILAANDRYVLGRPKLDEIEVRFFTDSGALVASLLAGAAELTLGRALSIEQAVHLRDQWREGDIGIPASFTWIVIYPQLLNPNPPVVSELGFRRALMYALDRQTMVDSIQFGLVPIAHTYIDPKDPEYASVPDRGIAHYEYDPRRSTQLLEGLGLARSAEGIYRNGGEKVAIELRTTGGEDIHEKSLFSVSDYWQRAGVAVDPVIVPQSRTGDAEYRATFPGFQVLQQPNGATNLSGFTSSKIPLPGTGFSGGNRSRYSNPEFDQLLDRYFVTIGKAERAQILTGILSHIADQLPLMGLFYNAQPSMLGNRLVNVPPGKPGYEAPQWDVRSLGEASR